MGDTGAKGPLFAALEEGIVEAIAGQAVSRHHHVTMLDDEICRGITDGT